MFGFSLTTYLSTLSYVRLLQTNKPCKKETIEHVNVAFFILPDFADKIIPRCQVRERNRVKFVSYHLLYPPLFIVKNDSRFSVHNRFIVTFPLPRRKYYNFSVACLICYQTISVWQCHFPLLMLYSFHCKACHRENVDNTRRQPLMQK